MGVLNINMRREKLGNLGAVPRVDTDNGAVSLARTMVAAAEDRQRHASDIPIAVANLGNDLKAAAAQWRQMIDRNRQRRFDAYSAHVQDEFNAYMLGDGSAENQGRYNENPTDTLTWAKEIQEKYAEISKKYREEYKIDDREWQDHVEKGDRAFRMQWTGRVIDRANSLNDSNAIAAAELKFKNIRKTISLGDATPEMYTQAAEDLEHLMDVKGVTDPKVRAETRRQFGMESCQEGVAQYFEGVNKRMDGVIEGGGDGVQVWDEEIKRLEEQTDDTSWVPPNAYLTTEEGEKINLFREWLTSEDLQAMKGGAIKQAQAERKKAEQKMEDHTVKAFRDAQTQQIFTIPLPERGDYEGQKRYYKAVEEAYKKIIARPNVVNIDPADKDLTWVDDRVKKYAPKELSVALRAIGEARHDFAETTAAQAKAQIDYQYAIARGEGKVDGVQARRTAQAEKARVEANGKLFEKVIELGIPDPDNPDLYHPLTDDQKVKWAEFLYKSDEISHADYVRAVKAAKTDYEPIAQQFFAEITRDMDRKFPKVCEWNKEKMAFIFKPTAEGADMARRPSGVKHKYGDSRRGLEEESLTFGQFVDAATFVARSEFSRGSGKKGTDAERVDSAVKRFKEMTQGITQRVYVQRFESEQEDLRKMEERMNANRSTWYTPPAVPGFEYSPRTQSRLEAKHEARETIEKQRDAREKEQTKNAVDAAFKQGAPTFSAYR